MKKLLHTMILVATGLTLFGCSQQRSLSTHGPALHVASADAARSLPIYNGRSGEAMNWSAVIDAAAEADVIIVGEQHDDAMGHAVELALAQDILARWPGSAVSMEMLERDEQPLVDDYWEGIIDAATFAKLTFSESWAGEGSWKAWYQPIIDAAKEAEGRVIAANAPRRYVRLARTDGYARLEALPSNRRALFDLPQVESNQAYRTRFFETMTGEKESATPATQPAATNDGAEAHSSSEREFDLETLEPVFRSQCLWDATMAASVAHAHRAGAKKVVHLIGQFHSDFEGGMVQQLRAELPDAKILIITMQREDGASLRAEDRDRADLVIYTGAR